MKNFNELSIKRVIVASALTLAGSLLPACSGVDLSRQGRGSAGVPTVEARPQNATVVVLPYGWNSRTPVPENDANGKPVPQLARTPRP